MERASLPDPKAMKMFTYIYNVYIVCLCTCVRIYTGIPCFIALCRYFCKSKVSSEQPREGHFLLPRVRGMELVLSKYCLEDWRCLGLGSEET